MATRAQIGRPGGMQSPWLARYHHYDGYPSVLGTELVRLIGEYGSGPVVWALTEQETVGFSSIFGCGIDENGTVVGAYSYSRDGGEGPEPYRTPLTDDDTEWAYVIQDDGWIDVFARGSDADYDDRFGPWVHLGKAYTAEQMVRIGETSPWA